MSELPNDIITDFDCSGDEHARLEVGFIYAPYLPEWEVGFDPGHETPPNGVEVRFECAEFLMVTPDGRRTHTERDMAEEYYRRLREEGLEPGVPVQPR